MVRLSATEEQISGSSVCYRRTRRTASDGEGDGKIQERLQRFWERLTRTKMMVEPILRGKEIK